MAIQRLTAAYRSRSRPSSTLGAKASTMCPYYLDGDLQWDQLSKRVGPGDTRLHWLLCSFQGPRRAERLAATPGPDGLWGAGDLPVSQNSTACGPGDWTRSALRSRPGSVDMLGPECAQSSEPRANP